MTPTPPTEMPDPQDKDTWVDIGSDFEHEFVNNIAPMLGLDAEINPEKETNVYSIDLVVDGKLTDLKRQTTPFFTAEKNVGIDPQYAITFNTNDYERYKKKLQSKGPIDILFWVSWPETKRLGTKIEAMDGIWRVSMAEIILMIEQGDARTNVYNDRTEGGRNATESYGLDLRHMTPLVRDDYRYFEQRDLEQLVEVSEGELYCFPEYIARIEDVTLDTSYKSGRLWEYPRDSVDSIADEITITYTKHPFVQAQANTPSVVADSQTTSQITASKWRALDETLNLMKVEPQSPSGLSSSSD